MTTRQTVAIPIAIGELLAEHFGDPLYTLRCRECRELIERFNGGRMKDDRLRLTCWCCGADVITFEAVCPID
jgi:hypothetical protein